MGSNGAGDLDDAEAVIVESGAAVDVDQAAAIQGISGYVGTMSDIDISDTAAALISATDSVLNVTGVDTVSVSDGPVTAADGATLNGFAADVDFSVRDIAANIVTHSANLDEATHIEVRDTVHNHSDAEISQANVIETIGAPHTTYSYSIFDTVQNLLNIQTTYSASDVTTYENSVAGASETVTASQLYNYVANVPTTSDVNPATNANFTLVRWIFIKQPSGFWFNRFCNS